VSRCFLGPQDLADVWVRHAVDRHGFRQRGRSTKYRLLMRRYDRNSGLAFLIRITDGNQEKNLEPWISYYNALLAEIATCDKREDWPLDKLRDYGFLGSSLSHVAGSKKQYRPGVSARTFTPIIEYRGKRYLDLAVSGMDSVTASPEAMLSMLSDDNVAERYADLYSSRMRSWCAVLAKLGRPFSEMEAVIFKFRDLYDLYGSDNAGKIGRMECDRFLSTLRIKMRGSEGGN
jgi:hypothetical protein